MNGRAQVLSIAATAGDDQRFLRDLHLHLAPLVKQGVLSPVPAASAAQADAVLVLLSAHLVADPVASELLAQVREERDRRPLHVIPILGTAVVATEPWLDELQAVPRDESGELRPIAKWADPADAWLVTVNAIALTLQALATALPTTEGRDTSAPTRAAGARAILLAPAAWARWVRTQDPTLYPFFSLAHLFPSQHAPASRLVRRLLAPHLGILMAYLALWASYPASSTDAKYLPHHLTLTAAAVLSCGAGLAAATSLPAAAAAAALGLLAGGAAARVGITLTHFGSPGPTVGVGTLLGAFGVLLGTLTPPGLTHGARPRSPAGALLELVYPSVIILLVALCAWLLSQSSIIGALPGDLSRWALNGTLLGLTLSAVLAGAAYVQRRRQSLLRDNARDLGFALRLWLGTGGLGMLGGVAAALAPRVGREESGLDGLAVGLTVGVSVAAALTLLQVWLEPFVSGQRLRAAVATTVVLFLLMLGMGLFRDLPMKPVVLAMLLCSSLLAAVGLSLVRGLVRGRRVEVSR